MNCGGRCTPAPAGVVVPPTTSGSLFQLTGYTLRPGFGYPLDEWRSEQTAALFRQGVAFHREKPVWIEYWIMWRRMAGGMSENRHVEIWNYLKPHSRAVCRRPPKQQPKLKGIQPEGLDEMVRLAAALEHLDANDELLLGDGSRTSVSNPGPWAWALGRVGARVPLYGSGHKAVDPEKASEWLNLLLDAHSRNVEGALFAIVQIARLSGDRSRDLDDETACARLEGPACGPGSVFVGATAHRSRRDGNCGQGSRIWRHAARGFSRVVWRTSSAMSNGHRQNREKSRRLEPGQASLV